jgi:hypothetical protein
MGKRIRRSRHVLGEYNRALKKSLFIGAGCNVFRQGHGCNIMTDYTSALTFGAKTAGNTSFFPAESRGRKLQHTASLPEVEISHGIP